MQIHTWEQPQSDDAPLDEVIIDHRSGLRGGVEAWMKCLAYVWADPTRDLGRLMGLLSPTAVLRGPTYPPEIQSRAASLADLQRTFRVLPDLNASVNAWSARDDVPFVELTFRATIGGRQVSWDSVERFRFQEGSAVERVAYFDPAPLRRAFRRNVRGFAQMLRLRARLR